MAMTSALLPTPLSPDRDSAFRAARRHSLQVRLARRLLALSVLAFFVAAAALALYRNFGHALRDVAFEGVGIEGGRLTMDKPRLSGSRPDGASYVVNAVKAMQDPKHPGAVDLALIGGDLTAANGEVSRLSAQTGHYESAGETLEMSGDVRVKNAKYEITMRSVHVAFKSNDFTSNEPVQVRIFPKTTIDADSLAATRGGAEVHFAGHVRTVIAPEETAAP